MSAIIFASVGKSGANVAADVRVVQRLLNDWLARTGQAPLLKVDGIAGPKTTAAIGEFQRRHAGIVDGRVDANGPTIRALFDEHLAGLGSAIDVSRLGGFVDASALKASATDPALAVMIGAYVAALRQP
jgi:peptidoglycan hydrolase-like protein with peptidoglycan-binding domain